MHGATQSATSTFSIIQFVLPQKLSTNFFLKGRLLVPREIENNTYAKLLGEGKLHGLRSFCPKVDLPEGFR